MDSQVINELKNFVFNDGYEDHHKDLRDLLHDDLFAARSGLTMSQAGHLSYKRSQFIHSKIEKPLDVLEKPERLFAVAEWAGLMDVSCFSILMVHYNLTIGTFFDHALNNKSISNYLEELNSLSSFGPYMATELGYGNNVAALGTEAIYDHENRCFYINTPDVLSQKYMSYSGFIDIPKIAVVMARLKIKEKDCGVFPFVVRISDKNGLCEGITAAPCPEKPVQGLDNGLTSFNRVQVDFGNFLSGDMAEITEQGEFRPRVKNQRSRFLKSMSRIIPGRLCVSSSALGAGKASVYIALKFAQNRLVNAQGAGSTNIINFKMYQKDMFLNLAKVFAMIALTNDSKRQYLKNIEQPSISVINQINLTKPLVTWLMSEVIHNCRERSGAQGIFSINRINDYISLLQGLITAEGDNQVLISTVAGQMINEPIKEQETVEAIYSFCASSVVPLLMKREGSLLKEISDKREEFSGSFFDEWNAVSNDAITAAKLRGNRIALQALLQSANEVSNPAVSNILTQLADLYALHLIQQESGWYLGNRLCEISALTSLGTDMEQLYVSLLANVNLIIDSFSLNEELLRAPICHKEYENAFTEYAHSLKI